MFSPLSNGLIRFPLKLAGSAADPQVVAQRSKGAAENLQRSTGRVQGERLRPIRTVIRELTRPDGTTIRVEVPVYPPFRLKDASRSKDPKKSD